MSEVEDHKKRLLLISNSTLYGGGYLDHAEKEIGNFLGATRRVLFIPLVLLQINQPPGAQCW
jgi:peptidase E